MINMYGTDYYSKIGQIIKELRIKSNLTKTELSNGICSPSYISRIENGERCPNWVVLRQISNKLGVSSEYLFRAIESPNTLHIQQLINNIKFYVERYDFYNIYKLLNEEEKNKSSYTIEELPKRDFQIISSAKCIANSMLNNKYDWGINELSKIINSTYIEGKNPNYTEFSLMFTYGFFLSLNKQEDDAYKYLIKLKEYMKNIQHFSSYSIFPRFYMHLAIACIDIGNFGEAFTYLESAIDYCRKYNIHSVLRELYYLKSEIYYYLKNENESKYWFNQSLTLHKIIKYSDTEFFDLLVKDRMIKREKMQK